MMGYELRLLQAELELSNAELAAELSEAPAKPIHERTVYRWRANENRIPGPAAKAIRCLIALKELAG